MGVLSQASFDTKLWEEQSRTKKFLEGAGSSLPPQHRRFLTPVALNTDQLNELKRKVGFIYSVPMFNLSTSVKFRGMTWLITSAGLIDDYNQHMLVNFGFALPMDSLETPRKGAAEVIEKHVRFWKGDCKEGAFKLIKVQHEDLYYGFKIVDEYFPHRPIRG